jgi:hypothetical protein
MFHKGDLVYIPQNVKLHHLESNWRMIVTDKPVTGVFIRDGLENMSVIYVNGTEFVVKPSQVFPVDNIKEVYNVG